MGVKGWSVMKFQVHIFAPKSSSLLETAHVWTSFTLQVLWILCKRLIDAPRGLFLRYHLHTGQERHTHGNSNMSVEFNEVGYQTGSILTLQIFESLNRAEMVWNVRLWIHVLVLISKLSCCKGGLCMYVSVYTNSGVLLESCHCIANVL